MSLVEFWQALRIALAVVLVLGVLYGFYRAKSYGYRNIGPAESIDIKVYLHLASLRTTHSKWLKKVPWPCSSVPDGKCWSSPLLVHLCYMFVLVFFL
jgi:hypothetical protein